MEHLKPWRPFICHARWICAFLFLLALMLPALTRAQTPYLSIPGVTETTAPKPEQIDALVKTLEAPAEREKLVEQLNTLKAAQEKGAEDKTLAAPLGTRLMGLFSEKLGEKHISAMALTVLILFLARFFVHLLRRRIPLPAGLKARLPYLEERLARHAPFVRRPLQLGVLLLAVLAILDVWGVNSLGWVQTHAGQVVLARLVAIGLVVAGAVVVWEVVSSLITQFLSPSHAAVPIPSARARTLLPLAKSAFLVLLVTLTGLIVLSELGIDTGPLLAGAGVVGLAIGFGAQTLVKDVITGMFILAEDTISVGDSVEVAGHTGTVEALSIRSLRLRDINGAVHTIPFSAVTTITNMTKDYSFAVFTLNVSPHEDAEVINGIFRRIGGELRNDPELGSAILEPVEVLGLISFTETAAVFRARIKTLPGKQWAVERAFHRLAKQYLEEKGIAIPLPRMNVMMKAPG